MAGRAMVVFSLFASITVGSYIFCPAMSGLSHPAAAGVYPQNPVQTSEAPWEHYTQEADVQRAVHALDRLVGDAELPEPRPKPENVQAISVNIPARVRRAARLVVPKPGGAKRDLRPRIAVVIDDLGLNGRRARRLIELDGPLTLAFLPYGYDLSRYTREAARRGHEIFLHLPMEPVGNENPGPNALLENLGPAEFERRMLWAFEQVQGIRGFNNHMGSRLTANPLAMERVMAEARKRKLLFLDSKTSGRSVAYSTAMAHGVPAGIRDIFLDHDPSAENVARQLQKAERLARRRGHAIAIGHPYDTTFSVLRGWIGGAKRRGFELVPVSVLIEAANAPVVAAAGGPTPVGQSGIHTSVQREAE